MWGEALGDVRVEQKELTIVLAGPRSSIWHDREMQLWISSCPGHIHCGVGLEVSTHFRIFRDTKIR